MVLTEKKKQSDQRAAWPLRTPAGHGTNEACGFFFMRQVQSILGPSPVIMTTARYLTFTFKETVDVSEIKVSKFVGSEARGAHLVHSDEASQPTVDGSWLTVATGKVFKVQLYRSDNYAIAEVVILWAGNATLTVEGRSQENGATTFKTTHIAETTSYITNTQQALHLRFSKDDDRSVTDWNPDGNKGAFVVPNLVNVDLWIEPPTTQDENPKTVQARFVEFAFDSPVDSRVLEVEVYTGKIEAPRRFKSNVIELKPWIEQNKLFGRAPSPAATTSHTTISQPQSLTDGSTSTATLTNSSNAKLATVHFDMGATYYISHIVVTFWGGPREIQVNLNKLITGGAVTPTWRGSRVVGPILHVPHLTTQTLRVQFKSPTDAEEATLMTEQASAIQEDARLQEIARGQLRLVQLESAHITHEAGVLADLVAREKTTYDLAVQTYKTDTSRAETDAWQWASDAETAASDADTTAYNAEDAVKAADFTDAADQSVAVAATEEARMAANDADTAAKKAGASATVAKDAVLEVTQLSTQMPTAEVASLAYAARQRATKAANSNWWFFREATTHANAAKQHAHDAVANMEPWDGYIEFETGPELPETDPDALPETDPDLPEESELPEMDPLPETDPDPLPETDPNPLPETDPDQLPEESELPETEPLPKTGPQAEESELPETEPLSEQPELPENEYDEDEDGGDANEDEDYGDDDQEHGNADEYEDEEGVDAPGGDENYTAGAENDPAVAENRVWGAKNVSILIAAVVVVVIGAVLVMLRIRRRRHGDDKPSTAYAGEY